MKIFFQTNPEQKPEMISTIESNYKVARRVYQHLYFDVAELFYEYIQSIDSYEHQDIEEDMKTNGWGAVKNIKNIKDSMRLLNIFQDFYTTSGRLPTFNELLIVPDGDAQPEEKINMKQLYDLFKNTNSHGLVSLPFLGILFYFFESEQDLIYVKHATTELYRNLSYMTLSGGRQLEFQAASDLIGQLSFAIKSSTVQNLKQKEIENESLPKKINEDRIFTPKINNPLDDVMEILEDPNVDHKKPPFFYVEPTVQLPDEIEKSQKLIDDDFVDLLSKCNEPNDVLIEQKKQKDIENLIGDVTKDPIPTNEYWWEEDIFSKNDKQPTIDITKTIVDDIKQPTNDISKSVDIQALSDNILRNLKPVDGRTLQQLIDDGFIPIDDRTPQQREDDNNISLAEDEDLMNTTSSWDENKAEIIEPRPIHKISTDYNKKVKAANKIKNKYSKN